MSDKLKSIVFLLILISGLAYYTYRYFKDKPFDPTLPAFEEANVKSDNTDTQSVSPLKLKLANNVYYAIAIDWNNTGAISQADILRGGDDIFTVQDNDGHFNWIVIPQSMLGQYNDYAHTLFSPQELGTEKKEFFSNADPEFRKLYLARIVNNMSGQKVNRVSDSGIASITLFKPNAAPKNTGAALQIGIAILHNNTQRAIMLVPMSVLPEDR